jgi:hypothetical protein
MHDIAINAALRELFGLLATAEHPGMKGQTTRRLSKPRQTARQIRIVILHSAVSDEAAFAGVDGADCDVAYPLDVEHAFYVFFALALLCALSVSVTERLRISERGRAALLTERATRLVFFLAISAVAAAGWLAAPQ